MALLSCLLWTLGIVIQFILNILSCLLWTLAVWYFATAPHNFAEAFYFVIPTCAVTENTFFHMRSYPSALILLDVDICSTPPNLEMRDIWNFAMPELIGSFWSKGGGWATIPDMNIMLLLYYFPSLFILLITHFGPMLHTLLFVIVYTYTY